MTVPAESDAPGHAWQYVIYPSGALYVCVQSSAPATGWTRPRVGYAIALDGRRGFRRIDAPASSAPAEPAFLLMARAGVERADLLWTWPSATQLSHRRELASADERRLAVIVGDVEASGLVQATHLLRIWPTDIDAAPEAGSFAADYRNHAALNLTAGHVMMEVPGDLDFDGYNESEGVYELALDRGVLRFDFAPGAHVRYDPVFRVHETAGRRCWVYARGRLVKDVGRDVDNNLLFRLARVAGAPVALEVHTTPLDGEP
jgi:hypothetical protein